VPSGGKEPYSIRIVTSHVLGRGRIASKGQVMRVPEEIPHEAAEYKIAKGYAVRLKNQPPRRGPGPDEAGGGGETASVSVRDPQPESRDPKVETPGPRPPVQKPKKRRRRRSGD